MLGKINRQILWPGCTRTLVLLLFGMVYFARLVLVGAEVTLAGESINLAAANGNVHTEKQVVDLALKNSRKIQSLRTKVAIANYRLKSSGWIRNPELRVSDVSTRYYTDEFDELRAGLRFRLPKPGELGQEKQEARVELWERRVDEIRFQQEFIAGVRNEYADVIRYDQLAELAQKRLAKEDERVRVVEQLMTLGQRSVINLTKAKVWQADAKNELARALQNQKLARLTLAQRAQIAENSELVAEELPEVSQDLDGLIKIAIKNRPEIELVQQQMLLANREKRLEYFKLIPWPNFVDVSYHVEKIRHRDWGELMTGITLPIFNWNIGNIKATSLAVKMKADELAAAQEAIAEEVRSAFVVYQDLLWDWKTFKSNADELIANAATIVDQAHQHKTLMPDEVLDLELTILETQKARTEKRHALAQALASLYFALGIDGHDKLIQPVEF